VSSAIRSILHGAASRGPLALADILVITEQNLIGINKYFGFYSLYIVTTWEYMTPFRAHYVTKWWYPHWKK